MGAYVVGKTWGWGRISRVGSNSRCGSEAEGLDGVEGVRGLAGVFLRYSSGVFALSCLWRRLLRRYSRKSSSLSLAPSCGSDLGRNGGSGLPRVLGEE